jgi:hypothetical protein
LPRGEARTPRTDETARCAVLYPAIAEAAHRLGAHAIGLVDVGRSAGLNLDVDRVGITYSDGRTLGDPSSSVQISASIVGGRPVPPRAMPSVVARIGIDRDPVDVLPDAVARVPATALPVVTTTWALSRLRIEDRHRFLRRLEEVAAGRPVAWVSVEGVGVAPGIPALGDRPASGHSIIGLALFDGTGRRTEAVGRCWSRGRWLSWLAD